MTLILFMISIPALICILDLCLSLEMGKERRHFVAIYGYYG